MELLLHNIPIQISEGVYLKDPRSSELGRNIIGQSILLIDEIGFESFTFKKLGDRIGSNESSVYRYFENKHKLLLYLTSWYWGWVEYRLVFATQNITDPFTKLKKAIDVISAQVGKDNYFDYIDEVALSRIVIEENSKSYLTKEVDRENKEGCFSIYKRVIQRLADLIKECQPTYAYSKSLASTFVEGVMHQYFLMRHFNSITNCDRQSGPTDFFTELFMNILQPKAYDAESK